MEERNPNSVPPEPDNPSRDHLTHSSHNNIRNMTLPIAFQVATSRQTPVPHFLHKMDKENDVNLPALTQSNAALTDTSNTPLNEATNAAPASTSVSPATEKTRHSTPSLIDQGIASLRIASPTSSATRTASKACLKSPTNRRHVLPTCKRRRVKALLPTNATRQKNSAPRHQWKPIIDENSNPRGSSPPSSTISVRQDDKSPPAFLRSTRYADRRDCINPVAFTLWRGGNEDRKWLDQQDRHFGSEHEETLPNFVSRRSDPWDGCSSPGASTCTPPKLQLSNRLRDIYGANYTCHISRPIPVMAQRREDGHDYHRQYYHHFYRY